MADKNKQNKHISGQISLPTIQKQKLTKLKTTQPNKMSDHINNKIKHIRI